MYQLTTFGPPLPCVMASGFLTIHASARALRIHEYLGIFLHPSHQITNWQEALQDFLSSWQDALAHMATPHQNMAVATEQLKSLRHTFSAYLVRNGIHVL